MAAEILYNDPAGGKPSSIGPQTNTFWWDKRALIDAAKKQFFSQLASIENMPKNMGKGIKRYHWLPLLDDLNVNSQGINAAGVTSANGNLYGSSKDIGTISSKLPALSESGGRVNRVGYTRVLIEATLEKMGFFDEFSQEAMDFDSEADMLGKIRRERILGANEITEDMLQIDLLSGAGVIRFGGVATQDSEITGEGANISVIDYEDLMRLSIDLDNNYCDKHTTVIKGSSMFDTVPVDAARVLYCGTEILPTIKKMVDPFGNQAFMPVSKYAAAGSLIRGEVGSIDQFRIVVVPKMLSWAGAGASVGTNEGYRETNGKYDVYPLLCVGNESFTTVGFQTDGKSVKYSIITKMPGAEIADRTNPFGEIGFSSIKWWYTCMILRPEHIALLKSVAEL